MKSYKPQNNMHHEYSLIYKEATSIHPLPQNNANFHNNNSISPFSFSNIANYDLQ